MELLGRIHKYYYKITKSTLKYDRKCKQDVYDLSRRGPTIPVYFPHAWRVMGISIMYEATEIETSWI